ncbi:MAG: hypothetical protein AB7Q42_00805 [Acidimicrobiia bacterium]
MSGTTGRTTTLLTIAAALLGALVTIPSAASGGPIARSTASTTNAGPLPNVYMVTDSVGLGAKNAVPAAFPGRTVVVDGTPALFVELLEERLVRPRIASNPELFVNGIAVVAGGYNYPYWDPERFDRSIDHMIATLRAAGARDIIWVTLREVKPQYITPSAWRQVQPYYWYFPTVNAHLRAALARHPDLSLADWAAVADRPGLTYDAIHLNTTGAALYAATIAEAAAAATTRLPAGTVTPVTVAGVGAVPADAVAVAVNLTAVNGRAAGFITAYPCGRDRPFTANGNHAAAATVNGAAIVEVGDGGRICLFNSASTDLVVDVQGWFSAADGIVPVGPSRAFDSRAGGAPPWPRLTPVEIDLDDVPGMSPDARAAILSVTVTEPTLAGYATAYPCGTPPPLAANLNFVAGATVPNMAVVAPGADRKVCVVTSQPAHVVVDVIGAFSGTAPVSMRTPVRLLDTRETSRLAAGDTVQVRITGGVDQPAVATGAFLNITAVDTLGPGFLTAYPCGGPFPPTSTLNTMPASTIANFALVGPGDGGMACVTTSVETDIVVDLSGWTDGFHAVTAFRALDTRFP